MHSCILECFLKLTTYFSIVYGLLIPDFLWTYILTCRFWDVTWPLKFLKQNVTSSLCSSASWQIDDDRCFFPFILTRFGCPMFVFYPTTVPHNDPFSFGIVKTKHSNSFCLMVILFPEETKVPPTEETTSPTPIIVSVVVVFIVLLILAGAILIWRRRSQRNGTFWLILVRLSSAQESWQ